MRLADLTIDVARSDAGVWWNYQTRQPCAGNKPTDGAFCVRVRPLADQFHNAMRDAMAPFVLAMRRGKADEGEAKTAIARVWASEVLIDWAGLDDVLFSQAKAVEFMADDRFRLIREFVEQAARAEWAYLADAEKEAQGN